MDRTNQLIDPSIPHKLAQLAEQVDQALSRHANGKAVTLSRATIDVFRIGHLALATFSAQAGPVIICAFAGFAVPSTIVQLLATSREPDWVWIFPFSVLCGGLFMLAQGAVTWIGLHGASEETVPTMTAAVRTALQRWNTLLPSAHSQK